MYIATQNKVNIDDLFFVTGLCVSSMVFILVSNMNIGIYLPLYTKIAAFTFFVFLSAASVRFSLLHPFMWLNISFMIYSLSATIIFLMGNDFFLHTSKYSQEIRAVIYSKTLDLQFISLVCFSLMIGRKIHPRRQIDFNKLKLLMNGNNWVFLISFVLSLIYLYSIINSGATSKLDLKTSYSLLRSIDFVYYIMNLCLTVYIIKSMHIEKKLPLIHLALFFTFLLITFSINGERDIIFRFIIIFILIYDAFYKKIRKKYLFLLAILILLSSTLLGSFKMYLMSGELASELNLKLSLKNFILTMLQSEFRTPSENLAFLLIHVPNSIPLHYGQSLLWDLQRAFIPGFLFPREAFMDSATWFTKTFFGTFEEGHGVGFTLVGVGFVNFGIAGIIVLFSAIGILIKQLYKWSSKSIFGFIFYINFIPVVIYSIRSTISPIISQSLKHILFPLIVILLIGSIKKEIFNSRVILRR